MKKVLYISSSIHGSNGESSKLASEYLDALSRKLGDINVTHRDLNAEPVPHLDAERFQAFHSDPSILNDRQREAVALSDTLIGELQSADEVLVAMPLYNFGVPSTFKAWIDHVARAGKTFHYTANGPEGLLDSKKVTVLAARGGSYQGTPLDTQTEYLRHIFGLIGLNELNFIYAEGLARSGDIADKARDTAREKIQQQAA